MPLNIRIFLKEDKRFKAKEECTKIFAQKLISYQKLG